MARRIPSPRPLTLAVQAAFLLFCCGIPASNVQAQAAKAGTARLEAIVINGSVRFKSDQIAAAIGMKPGMTVDRDTLQAGADKLAALGLFNSVNYKFSSIPSGVRVTYDVVDAPAAPVVFDNFPWVTDAEITDALSQSGILFDGTAPFGGTDPDTIAQAIEKFLDRRSIHAHVSHTLVGDAASGQQVQQFRADDVALTINSVSFSDDLALKDAAIEERLPDLIGKPYSRSLIQLFTFEQVRPIYLGRAYLRAEFPQPTAKLAPGTANPLDAKLDVTIPIVPGPLFTWAGIQWVGNTAVQSGDLDRLVDLKPNDPADDNRIAMLVQHVEAMYHQRGYLDFKLDLKPHFDEKAARVSYTANIHEGPQYHMGKLVLTGLSLEGERRIRKAWSIPPDAVFDESVYQDFIDHGIKQAFSGLPVHYDKQGHFLQQNTVNAKVDVLLDFQ
ncbi:MAG: POTRA domain-containing protein [Candidatus Acidiferrales bacterium]